MKDTVEREDGIQKHNSPGVCGFERRLPVQRRVAPEAITHQPSSSQMSRLPALTSNKFLHAHLQLLSLPPVLTWRIEYRGYFRSPCEPTTCSHKLVPPTAYTRQFSPCPDFTLNQQPPLPPSGPWGVTVGMSPSAFEAWAVCVEDYGKICGWMLPLATSYIRLKCSGNVQKRIDAHVNRQESQLLSTTAAINNVKSVVIGPSCVVCT